MSARKALSHPQSSKIMGSNGKGRKDNTSGKEENPFSKHAVGHESLAEVGREVGHEQEGGSRHRVRIMSKRVRVCDPDNLVGGVKHLVDALRIAKVIPEDDPKAITLHVGQEKVRTYKEEETWVEVTR